MARLITFLLRTAFLTFFALNAWNNLSDLDSFHPALAKNYHNFEKSFTSKTGINLPSCMSSAVVEKNSHCIGKSLAWTQLALSGAALFIWSGFTGLVGLVYFLMTLVQLNVARINMGTKLTDLEPFLLALGLFAASLALSCSGKGSCGKATAKPNVKVAGNGSGKRR